MNHSINLQGFNQEELTIVQEVLNDLFFTRGVEFNNALCTMLEAVEVAQPHSFVLASLFDVEAMSLEVPDHVYESDPMLEWVTCPCCEGEKWLQVEGSVWTKALFSDHRMAYAHRHLNHSYKICGRCNGVGEVLDLPHEISAERLDCASLLSLEPYLLAA